jgi:6-phosphogluconolactonase
VTAAGRRISRLTHVLVRSQATDTKVQDVQQQKDQEKVPESAEAVARDYREQPVRQRKQTFINVIPRTRWPKGIPPVMGAHLMDSGEVAPVSTSKGAGLGGLPHQFHYADKEVDADVVQFANSQVGAQGLARLVKKAYDNAIKQKDSFTLVLSGGSLLNGLKPLVGIKDVDYSKWHVFYVDERNVPHSHPDSTHKGANELFLSKVPIHKSQIHAIKEGLPVKEAATEYAGQLIGLPNSVLPRTAAGFPVFDLMLLGIGPDGHVASLFPNRPQTAATEGWVLPVDNSPKPPPERITMTLPVINAAKEVVIVAFGAGKAEIVQRALEVQALPGSLPAQLVRPESGKLTWYLDCESAQNLSIHSWEEHKEYPRNT